MHIQSISIKTFKSFCCYSITDQIQDLILPSFNKEGLATLFCKHTTTALIVNELEERLMIDLEEWLNQIAPPLIGYKHDDLHMRKNTLMMSLVMLTHLASIIAWQ